MVRAQVYPWAPAQSIKWLAVDIRIDDLRGPEIALLLEEHLRSLRALSPPESVHALDLGKLRQPDADLSTPRQK